MVTRIGAAAFATMMMCSAGAAVAQDRLVVVELYTSQGCSSCPPADDLFARLAAREDVLPLALHVDYWDYIGWKDSFANPAFSNRQKAYARVAGSRTVYTPQMIVGGVDHLVGTREMELGVLLERHADLAEPVTLHVSRSGDVAMIRLEPAAGPVGEVLVQLVRYMPSATVEIHRGENAGRTITYTNIVTDWRILGEWSGAEPVEMSTEVSGSDPAAVILQREGPGEIVAAAVLR